MCKQDDPKSNTSQVLPYTYTTTAQPRREFKGIGQVSVEYIVHIDWIGGLYPLRIADKEIAELSQTDPSRFIEICLGVPFDVYRTWIEQDGFIQCSGQTVKGRRCKSRIGRGGPFPLEQYAEMIKLPQFCCMHWGKK